jgi:hypothetical protein
MELTIKRIQGYKDYTIGALFIDNLFSAFVMEDEKRDVKVLNETRIPAGRYEIKLQEFGRMYTQYKKKYKGHEGMLHLVNVPGFEGILIHIGNTSKDTAGCLLLGSSHEIGKDFIANSMVTYLNFYFKVLPLLKSGQRVFITIND